MESTRIPPMAQAQTAPTRRPPVQYDANGAPLPLNLRKHLEAAVLDDEAFDRWLTKPDTPDSIDALFAEVGDTHRAKVARLHAAGAR